MSTQWVDPKRAGLVALVDKLQRASDPQRENACGCTRKRGPRMVATVVVSGAVAYAVPCNRCGGKGVVP